MTNDILYDRRVRRIALSLSSKYQLSIFCRKLNKEYAELPDQMNIKRIKCLFRKGFAFYAEFNFRLFFALLFSKSEAIIAVDFDTLPAAGLIQKITAQKKLILDAHELFEESVEIEARPKIKRFWLWVARFFGSGINKGISVSDSISKHYADFFHCEFITIRNLPNFYQPKNKRHSGTGRKIILYQGVLNQGRKLELLINSSTFLNDSFEIWIIGEGDLSSELRMLAKKVKQKAKISFFSWIIPEHLKEYTQKAFLAYNLLDQRSLSYKYSLANKYFDYMQAGVPSINSPFPEYQKIHDQYQCNYFFDGNDPKELARFIESVEKDKQGYEKRKAGSLLAAEKLNWEKEEVKLLEFIERSLEDR